MREGERRTSGKADPVALVTGASSRSVPHPELAREYGFTDIVGTQQSRFWDEHWAKPATRLTNRARAAEYCR
jgi:hypothetical protein